VPGFPSRSFERRGYKYEDKPWRRAEDPEWDWKSTTSSDESIGHMLRIRVIAELVDSPSPGKAILLIDTLMSHILKNNFYLVDWNGEPTLWGKWNPDYVNASSEMVRPIVNLIPQISSGCSRQLIILPEKGNTGMLHFIL